MFKIIKPIIGFFKPKCGEIPLFLIGMLLFAAAIVPEFVRMNLDYSQTPLRSLWCFAPLLILGLSVGAGLGTFCWDELKQNLWFVSSVILVVCFCGFLLNRENLLFRLSSSYRARVPVNPEGVSWVLYGWIVCLVGTVGTFAITKSAFAIIGFVSRKFKLRSLTRQRLLIGVAVALFAVLTVRNVMDFADIELDRLNWHIGPAAQVLIGLGVVLIGATLPAWALSKIGGWWGLLIGVVYLGAVAGLSASFVPVSVQLFIGVYAVLYSSIMVAMTGYRRCQALNEPPKMVVGFWGIGSVVFVLLVVVVLWNFNLSALVFGGSKRVELSRQLKAISTTRGVESSFELWNAGPLLSATSAMVDAEIGFSENADAKCLSRIANSPFQFGFRFKNVNPRIETSHLRDLAKWTAAIVNSTVTPEQIEDIASQSSQLLITNSYLSDSSGTISNELNPLGCADVGTINLQNMPPGETGKLLRCLDLDRFAGKVLISSDRDISTDDWREIIDSSQRVLITVYQRPPEQMVEQVIEQNIPSQLSLAGETKLDRTYWNLMLNTQFSISINPPVSADDLEKFWDAAFASSNPHWADLVMYQLDRPPRDPDLLTLCRKHHWVFEENHNGQPTGVLLPLVGVNFDQVIEFLELTTLCMDVRWIDSLRNYDDRSIPIPQDISALGNLSKLKRLDLPHGLWGADYGFLNRIPDLEHLQFDVFTDGSKNEILGFLAADCPNLRSLVLFGRPSKSLAIEISKLPNLESLRLIDIDTTLLKEGQREMIQAAVGEHVSLTIEPKSKGLPDVPAAFSDHVERVRKELRKKYLSDDGEDQ